MNGEQQYPKQEIINPRKELDAIKIQIYNARHSLKMMEAMEKKLMEMTR